MASNFPKPTPFMISEAVVRGLAIPAIQIDPRLNFVRGAYIFASDIQLLDLNLRTFRSPLEKARDLVVIPAIKQNFEEQGRPPWKRLTKKTIYNRLIEGYPRGPILDKSGRLKRAATKKNIWNITSAIGRQGYDMLQLRTVYFDQLVPYGVFHQFGSNPPESRTVRSLHGGIGRGGKTYNYDVTGMAHAFASRHLGFAGSFSIRGKNELYPSSGGKMPARPFISITLDDEIEIYNIFTTYLTTQVNKFWGMKGDAGL